MALGHQERHVPAEFSVVRVPEAIEGDLVFVGNARVAEVVGNTVTAAACGSPQGVATTESRAVYFLPGAFTGHFASRIRATLLLYSHGQDETDSPP